MWGEIASFLSVCMYVYQMVGHEFRGVMLGSHCILCTNATYWGKCFTIHLWILADFRSIFISPSHLLVPLKLNSCLFASFTLNSLVMPVQVSIHTKTLDTCLLGHVGLSDTLLHPNANRTNSLSNIEPSV